jgi:hypothetical protein
MRLVEPLEVGMELQSEQPTEQPKATEWEQQLDTDKQMSQRRSSIPWDMTCTQILRPWSKTQQNKRNRHQSITSSACNSLPVHLYKRLL